MKSPAADTATSTLTFRRQIDTGLRDRIGFTGLGFVAIGPLLVALWRPGLTDPIDVLVWMATGACFAAGGFLVAAAYHGIERVVTIDPRRGTVSEEVRTFSDIATRRTRRCDELGPLSVLQEERPGGAHYHLFATDADDGSMIEIADLTDRSELDRCVDRLARLPFGAALA